MNDLDAMAAKKFPLPNTDHTYTIVKFYNDMSESVRVGQWIEVIGIRGNNMPKNEQSAFDSTLDLFSGVPVLHAIAYNPLQPINNITAVDPQLRVPLIDYIASYTQDKLTAEFILLHLVSRVYSAYLKLDPIRHMN